MVVEKAFAKLHGSYEEIGHGGLVGAALEALTGERHVVLRFAYLIPNPPQTSPANAAGLRFDNYC